MHLHRFIFRRGLKIKAQVVNGRDFFCLYFQQFIGNIDVLNPQTYFPPFDEMR